MKTFVKILILPIIILMMSSCTDQERFEFLERENVDLLKENSVLISENDSLYRVLNYLFQNNLIKELPKQTGILNGRIEIVNIETGFDPYNIDRIWLPCVTISFKNTSDNDIDELVSSKAVFIDNKTGEQIGSGNGVISGSIPLVSGAIKRVVLKSDVGWGALFEDLNVSAHIYVKGERVRTIRIENVEQNTKTW